MSSLVSLVLLAAAVFVFAMCHPRWQQNRQLCLLCGAAGALGLLVPAGR